MFLASPFKNSSTPSSDIGEKLPSHRLGSAGPFVWYGMTEGSMLGMGSLVLTRGWRGLELVRGRGRNVVFHIDLFSPRGTGGLCFHSFCIVQR